MDFIVRKPNLHICSADLSWKTVKFFLGSVIFAIIPTLMNLSWLLQPHYSFPNITIVSSLNMSSKPFFSVLLTLLYHTSHLQPSSTHSNLLLPISQTLCSSGLPKVLHLLHLCSLHHHHLHTDALHYCSSPSLLSFPDETSTSLDVTPLAPCYHYGWQCHLQTLWFTRIPVKL